MRNVKCYVKDYPRPQFVRNNWMNLNGKWNFKFDDANVGEKEGWFNGFETKEEINVPFAYQAPVSGIVDKTFHQVMWYSKKVKFTKKENENVLIHLEGSDHVTKLWCNGIFVGTHVGGYSRATFDITNAIKNDEEALIVIRIEDDKSCTKPRGKQRWLDYDYGCWYIETSGIWKTVWAEVVSETRINRVKMTPIESTYHMFFEYEVENFKKGYSLRTVISYKDEVIADQTMALVRENHTFSIDLSNDINDFKIHWWRPEHPEFYDVEFSLIDNNGNVIDHVGSYTAFRIFKAEGNLLRLNLSPVYMRMVLEQGYWRETGLTPLNEDVLIEQIRLIQELGFNGIRMHQKIEDERFYYFCDVMGIMVWCELPSSYEFKDKAVDRIVSEWMQIVKQNYNHPSIVAWVPINESWGVNRLTSNVNEKHFTETLYHLTKTYDPMRPVMTNDGWEHTTSDIITLHNYSQDPNELKAFYENIQNVINYSTANNYSQCRPTFVNGHEYKGQPIMIDEFAGIGFKTNDDEGWGYGDKVSSKEAYVNRLASLVKVLRENPYICGFCVTQTTDVYHEINGLLDFDRKPKASMELMNKAITQK